MDLLNYVQDGGVKEKDKIDEYMKIFKKIVPKFGTMKDDSHRFFLRRRSRKRGKKTSIKKGTKKEILNNSCATYALIINLLLVLTCKRKACLINSLEFIINEKIIKAFEEMVDMLDGNLAFEWVCFIRDKFYDYQVIFYNPNMISKKLVHDTIESYNPNSKHKSSCCCTSCNGGEEYTKKLKKVLDYLCDPIDINDPDHYDYYIVYFDIKYKGHFFTPFFYMCGKKPSTKKLKEKFLEIKPVLDYLGGEVSVTINHNVSPVIINNKNYKKIK